MSINKTNSVFDRLDLSLLRHFFAIASFGGFSKASRATGLSQPALSLGLQRLERSLGVPLVERQKGRFALTAGGANLLAFCQKLEGGLESIMGTLGMDMSGMQKRLRVGCALSIGFGPLVKACQMNGDLDDPFELELVEQNTGQCIREVLESRLDAALVPDDVYDPRVALTPLLEDQVVLVGDAEIRRLFARQGWQKAVEATPLVTYPRETPMRALVDKLCLREELRFQTVITTNSVEGLKLLLRNGAGAGFVLRSLLMTEIADRELMEIRTPFSLPRTGIALATRTGGDGEPIRRIVTRLLALKAPNTSRNPARPSNQAAARRKKRSSRAA